jgi:hypothetical protein
VEKTTTPPAHTPGPWLVTKTQVGEHMIHLEDGSSIALVGDGPHEGDVRTSEANARLIAAAPELLEACKIALSKMTEFNMLLKDNYLSRVIAKAEGR